MTSEPRASLRDDCDVMLDDRDNRPPADWHNAKSADADGVGCAFWAAGLAGGVTVLLAGMGLAALSDWIARALMAVLP